MNDFDRRVAVNKFIDEWKTRGSEKSEMQLFWIALIRLFGIDNPEQFMQFELPIDVDDRKCFIDAWIPSTRVLIEQKSRGIDLDKSARQSDGKMFTPFGQALRYADALPYSRRPRWIVVCNFVELRIYNMDLYDKRRDSYQPNIILFERLPHEFSRLNFLIDPNDENVNPSIAVSKQATKLIKLVRDAIEKQCVIINSQCVMENPSSNYALCITHYALSHFCVRLMFCLYADDADIFAPKQFAEYFKAAEDRQAALVELFRILDTKSRPKKLRAELKAFPYVNGDLFRDAAESVPNLNAAVNHYILAAAEFDWIDVSPPIFGAMFESILNPEFRRKGGMHYTSIENIHRVIDPLFLDALHDEFRAARRKSKANRRHALEAFQLKLASLKFFDPACGSGNFLTETYLSIRSLENETIAALRDLGAPCEVLVSIENFYGVEINDFAVAVARTALWIAENQMLKRTASILDEELKFLPLTSAAHITQGNALRLDWNEIVPNGVDYIIGNPPFVGHQWRSKDQVDDMTIAFHDLAKHGKLDYVCAWFNKAADFMIGTTTRAAFVSTNSIVQGESVGILWRHLFDKDIHIDFTHRTFKWISDSDDMAAVFCVIVGFSHAPNDKPKIIFDGEKKIVAKNINGYLLDAPDVFIPNRGKPLTPGLPIMTKGSQPTDGGHLLLNVEERDELLRREPGAAKFIRPFIGAEEFIHGKRRYCLWLVDATEDELRLPSIAARLEAVRRVRLKSATASVRAAAATPHLFTQIRQPSTSSIIIPRVSGERRKYVPIGLMPPTSIASDAMLLILSDDRFLFGVLESSVHMAWMRAVAGYLGTSYRYSSAIYNNFVWCARSERIEKTAARILEVRKQFGDRSLASLYDESTMPKELRAAHLENDNAVLDAYDFAHDLSEAEIVSRLMELYLHLTQ